MRQYLAPLAMISMLTSCGVSTPALPTQEELSRSSLVELCDMYSYHKAVSQADSYGAWSVPFIPLYYNELVRRRALTGQNVADIKAHVIRTGMKDYVAICSWGPTSDINSSGGVNGSFVQYVMGGYGLGEYIYARNGRIVSWQK